MDQVRIDGAKLRKLRDARGLRQDELGEQVGVTNTQIHRLEAGKTNTTLSRLTALASALGVDPSELLAPAVHTMETGGEIRPTGTVTGRLFRGGKPAEVPKGPVTVAPVTLANVPLLGIVPGGPLALVEQAMDNEQVSVDPQILEGHPGAFAVRVSGDSMTPIIQDGEVVIVGDPRNTGWREGSIVIAEIEGEVTLKKVGWVDDELVLLPANNNHPPVRLGEATVKLQGVVIGVGGWRTIPH